MRRFLLSLTLLLAAAATVAPAAAAPTLRYKVTSATASVRLSFTTGTGRDTFVRGTVDVRITPTRRTARFDGSLASRGGRVTVPVRTRVVERVVMGERSDPTAPYVEQTCADRRFASARGGLTFRRVSRGRVEARWAFPHARVQLCPGPRMNPRAIERTMIRLFPASRLSARRTTLTLSGSRSFRSGQYRGTYRWRASVTLVRV